MVVKHVKQIFKSYVTKWLKWPVITDHFRYLQRCTILELHLQFRG